MTETINQSTLLRHMAGCEEQARDTAAALKAVVSSVDALKVVLDGRARVFARMEAVCEKVEGWDKMVTVGSRGVWRIVGTIVGSIALAAATVTFSNVYLHEKTSKTMVATAADLKITTAEAAAKLAAGRDARDTSIEASLAILAAQAKATNAAVIGANKAARGGR